ncbi:MAG: glucose-6-phosphate dehydrogenase [Thermoanaerobaculia bacterium]
MSTPEPVLFCIFGGTGDLSRRKLLPALCRLAQEGHLHPRTQVLGTGRGELSGEDFRRVVRMALAQTDLSAEAIAAFCDDRLHYQALGQGGAEEFQALGERLESLELAHDLPSNRVFYLALPPGALPPVIEGLGAAELNQSRGWTRLVVEKPFGRDLASARELNHLIHRYFSEQQVYRIDHYLGKETVQNLLVFRLSNALIESAWNRDRVDSIQITVGETLGVGSRAGYYDRSGAVRDMVQNHLTQLLSLVAMEVPSSFEANAIRFEKIKVLRTLAPIQCEQVVRGQYTAGEIDGQPVVGYLDEEGVPAGSQAETFVAIRMFVDSWRWQGVPFYLRTGKRMPRKMTQIAVRFREAPVSFFEKLGCSHDTADVLVITLQPDEGFTLHLDIKAPGTPFHLERIPLHFHYQDRFAAVPDAYQTLLEDVISGDQTLFVHGDEVEESWRVYTPLLENPPRARPYAAGTWGPPEADLLAIVETDLWQGEE